MKGLIFSIKRYSVHDGPGIRVTFFMKGCPLRCMWCHNPEGISPFIESVENHNKLGEKEFSATETVGIYYSSRDLLEIAERERVFMTQSGGGVTFSGGEPLMQAAFLEEAMKLLRENGYHTAVDTSGYARSDDFLRIMPYTSMFLFDLKHLDDEKHIQYTGVSNRLILENLDMLARSGKEIYVRIPVIPGYNDDQDHLGRLRDYIASSRGNITRINLLPFHRTGSAKYKKFNLQYRMGDLVKPSPERMKEIRHFMQDSGCRVKIGG
ncbi:MAG: glycyl-radical enzyme activating protein [Bacteroidales bacterium]|nr:glycyl-radical enzyme activating protein [Bacteroidales bacterium]